VIANISARLETLRETKARRKTAARTSQIEALERRLWQLENPGSDIFDMHARSSLVT